MVYKVNDFSKQEALGFAGKEPRWAVAHKFKPEMATAKIQAIVIQVGRTGKITPVAQITPTFVGGATVTNVTLHNLSEIHRKDIRLGDEVYVQRAGDVIPEITAVVQREGVQRGPKYQLPDNCPHCDTPLTQQSGFIDHFCMNPDCGGKAHRKILHFVSRNAADIDGVGEKLIEQLIAEGLLQNLSDLYSLGCRKLHPGDFEDFIKKSSPITRRQICTDALLKLEGFQEKAALNFVSSINKSKTIELDKFIYALGIKHVGQATATDVAQHYKTLQAFLKASLSELTALPDIGPETSKSIAKFLANEQNQKEIELLLTLGVKVVPPVQKQGPLAGYKMLMTGSPLFCSADAFEKSLADMGATITLSVSANTDLLIVGNKPGKTKMATAEYRNVQMLDISECESSAVALELLTEVLLTNPPKE